MPDTQTTNYNWTKPEPGGSDDTWGVKLNAVLDSIDAKMKEVADSVTAAVRDQIYPIDSTIITLKTGNPATWLGFGTWVAEGAGLAIVGVGTYSGLSWTAGQIRGAATHSLIAAELPAHQHLVDPPNTAITVDAGGVHTHRILESAGGSETNAPNSGFTGADSVLQLSSRHVEVSGNHAHTGRVDIQPFYSGSIGSGSAHNNIQPSKAYYIWRRTE